MTSLVIWLYIVAAMLCGLLLVGIAGPLLTLRGIGVRSRGMRASGFVAPLTQDSGLAFEGDRVVLDLEGTGLDPDRLLVGPLLCAGGGELAVSEVRAGADPARVEVVVDACPRGLHRITGVRLVASVAASCTAERRPVRVRLPHGAAVPAGWSAIRTALAGWRPGAGPDGADESPAAVEVTVDRGGLRLRVGGTTVPVDPAL